MPVASQVGVYSYGVLSRLFEGEGFYRGRTEVINGIKKTFRNDEVLSRK